MIHENREMYTPRILSYTILHTARVGVLPISLPFEHCMLRELMRTSLLIRDGLRKDNAANLHRPTATH